MTEFNQDQEVVEQEDAASLEEANYWFTINEFVELILNYGPQVVLPDFEKQMGKAKAMIRQQNTGIILPNEA